MARPSPLPEAPPSAGPPGLRAAVPAIAPENHGLTRERILLIVLAGVTLIAFWLAWRVALPFVPALTWALVLAVVAFPVHAAIEKRLKRPWLAAAVGVVVVALAVALPAAFLIRQVAIEALSSAESVREMLDVDRWNDMLKRFPSLAPLSQMIEDGGDLRGALQQASGEIAKRVRGFLGKTLEFATTAVITLFLLFYFLRDWRRFVEGVRRMVPLAPAEAEKVMLRVRDTIHATVFGRLAVSAVQGALGGLMFWWLGLPAPILWGAAMAVLAVLPILGPAVIWLPAAIFLGVQGDWTRALILVAWGTFVVGVVDNLLYPVLVRNRMQLHTVPVFVAVLGGLVAFGITGMVLGPLVLAVALALIDVWRRRMNLGEIETGVDRSS